MLLMCDVKERVLSRMTPRLFTWGEGEMKEWSKGIVKLLDFLNVELVPINNISVLSLFSLRKLTVNQDFISRRQLVREEGGRRESGLEEM